MKNTQVKMILGCLLLTFFTLNSFAQSAAKPHTKVTKMAAKIEKSKVPTVVTETFMREYPMGMYENWYGYPEYNGYGYDPNFYYYNDYPENYIVEFTKDKVKHKVFYSKTGKKIATHTLINANIPKSIMEAVAKSHYKSYKLQEDKEEILKDGDSDLLKVYKVEVRKGNDRHALFYDVEGKLMKDVKLKV
jgi:hypothetical protein